MSGQVVGVCNEGFLFN